MGVSKEGRATLNISSLVPGPYFVAVQAGTRISWSKLMVK
jgi:hypothetical protein